VGKGPQRIWVQSLVQVWDTSKFKEVCKSPVESPEKGRCYKQNLSVGTDPTYPVAKPVTTPLVARHEAEAICTSGGPLPEVVKKGKKKGERLARSRSQDHPPWVLSFLSFLDGQNGLGDENYGQWDENELTDF
jgi:hypothetical protein